jgi:ABC-type uncharacterized transport system permease subunit
VPGMIHEIVIALVTIFALSIMVISAFSYKRSGNRKILIVTLGFGLFFVKGVILSVGILQDNVDWEMLILYSSILDLLVIMLFFVAIIVRKK